jgi:hypothetical protein
MSETYNFVHLDNITDYDNIDDYKYYNCKDRIIGNRFNFSLSLLIVFILIIIVLIIVYIISYNYENVKKIIML